MPDAIDDKDRESLALAHKQASILRAKADAIQEWETGRVFARYDLGPMDEILPTGEIVRHKPDTP